MPVSSFLAAIFGSLNGDGVFYDTLVRRLLRCTIFLLLSVSTVLKMLEFKFVTGERYNGTVCFSKMIIYICVSLVFYHGKDAAKQLRQPYKVILSLLPLKSVESLKRRDIIQTLISVCYVAVSVVSAIITTDQLKQDRRLIIGNIDISVEKYLHSLDFVAIIIAQVSFIIVIHLYLLIIYTVYLFTCNCKIVIKQVQGIYFDTKYLDIYHYNIENTQRNLLIHIEKYLSVYNDTISAINKNVSFVALIIFSWTFHFSTAGLAFYFVHLYKMPLYNGFLILGYLIVTLIVTVIHIMASAECSHRNMINVRLVASEIISSIQVAQDDQLIEIRDCLAQYLSTDQVAVLTAWNLFNINAHTGLVLFNAVVPFTIMTINNWRE